MACKISYNEALEIFKKYDKNKDGKMNRKEFKPAFKELISYKMNNDEINESFNLFDLNHDGVVNFTEFWTYCKTYNESIK